MTESNLRLKESEDFNLDTPEHVASLATSGMLVATDINVWSATKQDQGLSTEVTNRKKAHEKAGRFVRSTLPTLSSISEGKEFWSNLPSPGSL